MIINPATCIDCYKADHKRQYPEGTDLVYSNLTPRSDRLAAKSSVYDGKVVVFGIQYFVKSFLIDEWDRGFFHKPKKEVVAKYKRRLGNVLGIDIPIGHIEDLHDLGFLPLQIKAIDEGEAVNIKVPNVTVRSTRKYFWLTNYIESVMSTELWQPMTSATTARQYRMILDKAASETCDDNSHVDFQAHDFSFRGMAGIEAAAKSSAAHLLFFRGTDTIPAIDLLEDYYGADSDKELVGCSVPATEHSVMCMGTKDDELGTFRRLITELYPSGIVSIVSDTWDLWKVLDEYAPALKEEIEARDGKVVFRPDSGNPADVICGQQYATYKNLDEAKEIIEDEVLDEATAACDGRHVTGAYEYEKTAEVDGKIYKIQVGIEYNRHDKTYYYVDESEILSCEEITLSCEDQGCLELLWKHFGGTVNSKGYKVLNPKVGLIYGDSITLERAEEILRRMKEMGFAASNIVFGVGSFTYQHVTRDTYGFAMKATFGIVNGEGREIFKDPITDNGTKKSAKGLIVVNKDEDGNYSYVDEQESDEGGELKTVFIDGDLYSDQTLSEIRGRI